jgi:hypothetical protein
VTFNDLLDHISFNEKRDKIRSSAKQNSVGDPDPQLRDPRIFTGIQIRNNFHADLTFADLKYTFKIWKFLAQCKKID